MSIETMKLQKELVEQQRERAKEKHNYKIKEMKLKKEILMMELELRKIPVKSEHEVIHK